MEKEVALEGGIAELSARTTPLEGWAKEVELEEELFFPLLGSESEEEFLTDTTKYCPSLPVELSRLGFESRVTPLARAWSCGEAGAGRAPTQTDVAPGDVGLLRPSAGLWPLLRLLIVLQHKSWLVSWFVL